MPSFHYDGSMLTGGPLDLRLHVVDLISYLVFADRKLCDMVIQQQQRAKIERVYNEVVRVDEAQSSGELGALRKTVWEATRRKQRAEEALRLIEP